MAAKGSVRPVPVVGVIANPFSGKDVRRIVGYGSVSDNLGKVRALQRVLVGAAEAGVRKILFMPDPFDLVPAAYQGLRAADRRQLAIQSVFDNAKGAPQETRRAAAAMAAAGAGAIVTMGGDGTNRLAALGAGETPLLPLAVGTNNVFPVQLEPTVAGLAAGVVAQRGDGRGCRREKAIRVLVPDRGARGKGAAEGEVPAEGDNPNREETDDDFALIDVAFLHGTHKGSRAVWHPENLRELIVTQGAGHLIGLAAIAGQVQPVERFEAAGAYIRFAPDPGRGQTYRVPIGPGRFADVDVSEGRRLAVGEALHLQPGPGILAYDGERSRAVPSGVRPRVEIVADGPVVIDVSAALADLRIVP